jgi:chaperonin cofactor prefoldin
MARNTGSRYDFPPHDIPRHDSPLFDRTGSDEYTQLQDARKVTNHLQQRVHDLETRNQFLEYQLEDDATKYMEKETDCVSIERIWKAKCEVIENEISTWKRQFEAQQLKGDRVREHLSHTERELYGMLQRKYELIRGPGGRPTGKTTQHFFTSDYYTCT